MIPTRFMREAGINSGDNCYVIADSKSNMVLVCKEDPSLQGVNFTVQKVEKDGELRLSSKTLRLADLTDNKFVIETTDQTLGSQTVKVVAVKKNTVASATTN
jgi:bifunctional DNA-binding transcriptional regulator/antitoxin component of YhaV-PrlF toxin-antitoxin module